MLQSLPVIQRFDIVRPFNTFLFVTSQLLGEVYYLLYADDCGVPSKVAYDPEEPSLGRIQAESVAPPHSPASIKRCISRVEKIPALAHAEIFADISCDAPLKEGYISILGTDGPGLSEDEPMSIIQTPIVQVESPIPEGRYGIRSRAVDFLWNSAGENPIEVIRFYRGSAQAKDVNGLQVRSIIQ